MEDIKYWVIVGRERCADGVWRWTHELKHTFASGYCIHKILSEGIARECMRNLKRIYLQERCQAKLGKVRVSEIKHTFLNGLAFDDGDYRILDEYAECIQVSYREKPAAIFYCVPMYHTPNIFGSMY